MNPLVTCESIGTTGFGDPELLVTIQEPHPKAGWQLLARSTASMDRMEGKRTKSGKVSYLVDLYPLNNRPMSTWLGTIDAASTDELVDALLEYADWWYRREQRADRIDVGGVRHHLDRMADALYGATVVDYEQEWAQVLEHIARIDLVMRGLPARSTCQCVDRCGGQFCDCTCHREAL